MTGIGRIKAMVTSCYTRADRLRKVGQSQFCLPLIGLSRPARTAASSRTAVFFATQSAMIVG